MLRTIFMIGLFALLGLFVLNIFFRFLFPLLGLLIGFAIKIAVIGLVVYVIIRIVSPETARRLRDRFSGSGL